MNELLKKKNEFMVHLTILNFLYETNYVSNERASLKQQNYVFLQIDFPRFSILSKRINGFKDKWGLHFPMIL